jgi:hypothetical protein
MLVKEQFIREVESRACNFNSDFIVDVIRSHPELSYCFKSIDEHKDHIDKAEDFRLFEIVSNCYLEFFLVGCCGL